jgi:ABC-type transport system substrate-binding protein
MPHKQLKEKHMKKMFRFATVLVILAMILTACQAATPTAVVEPTEAPAQETEAPVVEPTEEPAVVATEEPTEAPTEAATEAPTEAPSIVDKVNMDYEGSIVTITLKPGLKWSDGSDLTTKDIVGSYQLSWANNAAVWTWLEEVEAVDDLTVAYYLKENSMRIIRYLLRTELVYPYSVFGEWMDKAAEFRKAGVDRRKMPISWPSGKSSTPSSPAKRLCLAPSSPT